MSLAHPIQRLLDRAAISDAKHAFIRAADARDPDRLVARFVDDCMAYYELGGPPIVGRAALRAWYADRLAEVTASSHHLSNLEFDFHDDDSATVYSYFLSWQHFANYPERPDRNRYARYKDIWVKRDGEWWQTTLYVFPAGEWNFADRPRFGGYDGWDADLLRGGR